MKESISIPATVKDMRIRHIHFLFELNTFKDREPTDEEISRMNASFIGVQASVMRRYTKMDNRKLFLSIKKTFDNYKPSPLEMELEYKDENGNKLTYEFISDFTRVPLDWHIDKDNIDFKMNPIDMASLCYIEKGSTYGESDENDNLIHPRSKRNKIFTDQMPLSVYLDIQSFFLLSWHALNKLSRERNQIKHQNQQR